MKFTQAALVAAFLSTAFSNTQALGQTEETTVKSSERYLIDTKLAQAPPMMHVKGGDGPQFGPGMPPPPHPGFGPPGGPFMGFSKILGLSDEQREKLHSIREQEFLASISRHAEMTKLRHQIGESLRSGQTDKNVVLQLQSQLNNLSNADEIEKVTSMVESNAVLTAEQRKLMRKAMLEHEPLFPPPPGCPPGGPGPGPGGPGGPGGLGGPGGPGGRPGPGGPGMGHPPGPMGTIKPAPKTTLHLKKASLGQEFGPAGTMALLE